MYALIIHERPARLAVLVALSVLVAGIPILLVLVPFSVAPLAVLVPPLVVVLTLGGPPLSITIARSVPRSVPRVPVPPRRIAESVIATRPRRCRTAAPTFAVLHRVYRTPRLAATVVVRRTRTLRLVSVSSLSLPTHKLFVSRSLKKKIGELTFFAASCPFPGSRLRGSAAPASPSPSSAAPLFYRL